jgi:hypothetical protein
MKFKTILSGFLVASVCLFSACTKEPEPRSPNTLSTDKPVKKPESVDSTDSTTSEPKYITVQHCLIGFQGSVPDKPIKRSKSEAKKLAEELFEKAKGGEDFAEIIKQYTDDSPPGIYKMANFGAPVPSTDIYQREGMVGAFGDVGFPLKVGEFGLAPHDPIKSPYGWHIIKRVE